MELCNLRTSRGQISAYDFMIAMFLFLLMFITLNSVWTGIYSSVVENQIQTQMHDSSYKALEVLIKTKGYPANWEDDPSNAESIGLAKRKNVFDDDKVTAFKSMDYDLSKELMGLGLFEYYLDVDSFGTANDFTKGISLPTDKDIYSASRIVNYKGAEAVVTLYVFQN
ncbi:MAG: hypothetical protein V1672_01165 [Candidatus Diapherotrites archaeon]